MNAPDTFNPAAAPSQHPQVQRPLPGIEARRQPSRRVVFVKWLRKIHGWIGLWGAVLGLLFGSTGFLLNHRGGPLRISTGEPQVSQIEMPVPPEGFNSPVDMTKWLRRELDIDGKGGRAKREAAHPVGWGDHKTIQPEQWTVTLGTPSAMVSAEYWVGNGFVSVKRSENSFVATLTNLHKGVGLSIGWVLLIDTLAGSIILLSLTGVLLWTELHKRKTIGALIVGVSIVAMVCCGLM